MARKKKDAEEPKKETKKKSSTTKKGTKAVAKKQPGVGHLTKEEREHTRGLKNKQVTALAKKAAKIMKKMRGKGASAKLTEADAKVLSQLRTYKQHHVTKMTPAKKAGVRKAQRTYTTARRSRAAKVGWVTRRSHYGRVGRANMDSFKKAGETNSANAKKGVKADGTPRKERTKNGGGEEPKKGGKKGGKKAATAAEPKKGGKKAATAAEPKKGGKKGGKKAAEPAAEPKKRGRKPKAAAEPAPEPKKRGRPKKAAAEPEPAPKKSKKKNK